MGTGYKIKFKDKLRYAVRKERTEYAQKLKADQIQAPIPSKHEAINEFVKRGGEIKKYAYKKPPCWKKTFNGFPKYGKRYGKV